MLSSLHPVLQLLTANPHLVLDHLGSYAEWLTYEVTRASSQWRQRLILVAVALVSAGAAVVLGGIAAIFAVMLPVPDALARWVLVAAPLLPFLLALGCILMLRPKPQTGMLDQLKSQIHEDVLMFREASTH